MSHVATIDLEIKDLDCLVKAAGELGLTFQAGKQTYRWFGKHVGDYPMPEGFSKGDLGKCDHALSVRSSETAYEIGIVKRGGKWVLLWDFWRGGHGLQACVGKGAKKLVQGYAKQVALKKCKRLTGMGWKLKQENLSNGEIKISLEK